MKVFYLPLDFMVTIYDKVRKRCDDITAALVLYESGWELGSRLGRSYAKKYVEPSEAIYLIPEVVKMIGLDAEVKDGLIVVRGGPGLATACSFERGLVAGVMSGLTRAPWDARAEIKDDLCIIKPRVRGVALEEVGSVREDLRSRVQGDDLL